MTITNDTDALVERVAEQGVRFNRWVSRDGEVRFYVNGDTNKWADGWLPMGPLLAGVEVSFYKSGNVAGASIWSVEKQEFGYISNTQASRYLDNRAYFTEDGVLHGSRVVKSLKPFLEDKFREAGLLVADEAETAEVNSND